MHFEFQRTRELEEKERMLIDTLKNKETPVSQILQEYFSFKYERFHKKIDNEIRQNILGEEKPIGD